MFSVIFDSEKPRRKTFKTLRGAQKSIWNWLRDNEGQQGFSATLMGPNIEPEVISDWTSLPFKEDQPKDFLQTNVWKQLRQQAFVKYGNRCACCGRTEKDGIVLHVDHIKPRSLYPELEQDINNLQILCSDCNIGKSNLSEMKWR